MENRIGRLADSASLNITNQLLETSGSPEEPVGSALIPRPPSRWTVRRQHLR
jgi:hypothetical protein